MMEKFFLLIMLFGCGACVYGISSEELSLALKEWRDECYQQPNRNKFSSNMDFYNEKFNHIIAQGPQISAPLMSELQKGNEDVTIFLPKLFKIVFDSSFDPTEKKWLFDDYPEYVYYPLGFHPKKESKKNDTIWLYWWSKGRKMTPQIFLQKYTAYVEAKKVKKGENIKIAYMKLQNMGIIILPNLLEKIERGDHSLIPMFCDLSGQSDLKTVDDCKNWWNSNKEKYKDVLDY